MSLFEQTALVAASGLIAREGIRDGAGLYARRIPSAARGDYRLILKRPSAPRLAVMAVTPSRVRLLEPSTVIGLSVFLVFPPSWER